MARKVKGQGRAHKGMIIVMMVARLKLHMCSWVFLHPNYKGTGITLCSLCETTSYPTFYPSVRAWLQEGIINYKCISHTSNKNSLKQYIGQMLLYCEKLTLDRTSKIPSQTNTAFWKYINQKVMEG